MRRRANRGHSVEPLVPQLFTDDSATLLDVPLVEAELAKPFELCSPTRTRAGALEP
jgi:hypothetical protein